MDYEIRTRISRRRLRLILGAVFGAIVLIAPTSRAAPPSRVLVLLVNFQDFPLERFTVQQASEAVFTTVNNFYKEQSYGRISFTGNAYGWFTLPIFTTCDEYQIANNAMDAAVAAGIDTSAYDRFIYMTSALCGEGGMSHVGEPFSWIYGAAIPMQIAHELGHQLGLVHADSLECGAKAYAPNSCSRIDYGDFFDTMGEGNTAIWISHFNAAEKESLGWLSVPTLSASGTYSIGPLETSGSTPRAYKIPVQVGSQSYTYYVEFRRPVGFDHYLPAGATNGILIHLGGRPTGLLDTTPQSAQDSADWLDPVLVPGASYQDTLAGVTIKTVSVTSSSATFRLTLAPPPPDKTRPVVRLTAPADGSVLHGFTAVHADASDDVGLQRIDLLLDDSLITHFLASPVDYAWDSTYWPVGAHRLNVKATDWAGNESSASVHITIQDAQAPWLQILAPAWQQTVSGPVSIQVAAHDNVAVARVDYSIDDKPLTSSKAAPFSVTWDSTKVPNGNHEIEAMPVDTSGNMGPLQRLSVVVKNVPDSTPPSAPTHLTITGRSASSVALSWTAAADNVGVTGYRLQVSTQSTFAPLWKGYPHYLGVQLAATAGGLLPSKLYFLRVRAVDAAGNLSAFSAFVSTMTPADALAPTPPSNVRATAVYSSSFTLAWGASSDNVGIAAYHIDLSTASTFSPLWAPYKDLNVGNVTSRVIAGLRPGSSYFARVRAYDSASPVPNASAESNVATVSVRAAAALESANTSQRTSVPYSVRVYPNPWRKDRDTEITFEGYPEATVIKIFTVSAHYVASITVAGGRARWNVTNANGEPVASGIYLYLATDPQGRHSRGKLAVIR